MAGWPNGHPKDLDTSRVYSFCFEGTLLTLLRNSNFPLLELFLEQTKRFRDVDPGQTPKLDLLGVTSSDLRQKTLVSFLRHVVFFRISIICSNFM